MGLLPQLKLLDVFSHKSGHDKMSKQCNHIKKEGAHTILLRHGQTDTDIPFINFNSHLDWYQTIWLVMLVILPSHIAFLYFTKT